LLSLCFIFASCSEIDSGVYFRDYDEFVKNMEAWTEPVSSSMTYMPCNPAGPCGKISVKCTGSEKQLMPEQTEEPDPAREENLRNNGYLFFCIKDVYDYIESTYRNKTDSCSGDERYDFYVRYSEIRGLKYPSYFEIERTDDSSGDDGYCYFILNILSYEEE
ncbi:MAG: hypothetical protein J5780_01740, partial [Treponema sp.]|nr:hypothetical protein [Treponema sp.]